MTSEGKGQTPGTGHWKVKVLPRLIFIADGFTRSRVADVVLDLGRRGVLPWVQLRDHDCDEVEFERTARRLVDELRARSPETMISLNGHADLAAKLGVGLHIGFRGPKPRSAREIVGPTSVLGYSAHSTGDLSKSVIASTEYTLISPIFDSNSKANLHAAGLELLANIADISPKPVYALGGVTPERVGACLRAGAYGAAVVGGILASREPVSSAEAYLMALQPATSNLP